MKRKSMNELQRPSLAEYKLKEKHSIIIALDDVRSMHNVGSVFRTADAFGLHKILLGGITPQPPHRDIQKAALGATESVDWSHEQDLKETLTKLKDEGWEILSVEQVHDSISLEKYSRSKNDKIILVFGNEVHGVSDDVLALSSQCIEIPQHGTKHSLNISVSVGVVLWGLLHQL